MWTEQLIMCVEPQEKLRARLCPFNWFKLPLYFHITDHSKVVLLRWLTVLLVLMSVSVLIHLLYVGNDFS